MYKTNYVKNLVLNTEVGVNRKPTQAYIMLIIFESRNNKNICIKDRFRRLQLSFFVSEKFSIIEIHDIGKNSNFSF